MKLQQNWVSILFIAINEPDARDRWYRHWIGQGFAAIEATLRLPATMADVLERHHVFGRVTPAQKRDMVLALQRRGHVVAMTGDGINDAPSLAAADLGISFGDATKIAINSAQVIILNNSGLLAINAVIRIGKLTMTTIRQNLFWAFFYNVVAIPIAAMGFLSPMVAAFSMAFSDVIVIGNSIRLKFRK